MENYLEERGYCLTQIQFRHFSKGTEQSNLYSELLINLPRVEPATVRGQRYSAVAKLTCLVSPFIIDLIIPPVCIWLFVFVTKQRKDFCGIWHNRHCSQALRDSRHHCMARQQVFASV